MVFLNTNLVGRLIFFMILIFINQAIPFDVDQNNKYKDTTIRNTTCNIQTRIDFFFDPNTKLSCDGTTCSVSNP